MSEYLEQKVMDMHLERKMPINDLVGQMERAGGFSAKKVGVAANIFANMLKEKDCVRFLSFPACIVATGTRGVITDMIKKKMFDVIITTCGTLDHDIARTKKDYYQGDFSVDDTELHKQGINRN
jgi:deoxyhypusine synthase